MRHLPNMFFVYFRLFSLDFPYVFFCFRLFYQQRIPTCSPPLPTPFPLCPSFPATICHIFVCQIYLLYAVVFLVFVAWISLHKKVFKFKLSKCHDKFSWQASPLAPFLSMAKEKHGGKGGGQRWQPGVDDFFADYRKLFNAAQKLISVACRNWWAEKRETRRSA